MTANAHDRDLIGPDAVAEKNDNYKHGRYTKEVAATRQWVREAIHMLRG
jgi:hypothetical protein